MASFLLALVVAGCGATSPSSGGDGGADVSGRLTVLGAASLTEALAGLGEAFEQAHPGVEVEHSFAGSSTLATQIREGAPADLFASADPATMARLGDEGLLAGEPVEVATNRLVIVVEPGNPKDIASLADLAAGDVVYVTAAPHVPIARYAAEALDAAGVSVTPASEESDVRGILTKVVAGEADAGIVYATDVVAAAGRAEAVELPSVDVVVRYPAAVLADAGNPTAAQAFLEFLRSPDAGALLRAAGFATP
jgi:molybdate transport system substrate-binding protein